MRKSNELKWEGVTKQYSIMGGIKLLAYIIEKLQITEKLSSYLPTKKRNRGISSINKFLILLYSLICGADCLDDIEDMREDPLFAEITGGGMAAITGGDFLRSLKKMALENLKEELISNVSRLGNIFGNILETHDS
ncbi:MAG: transposase [Oligoflexia bacterium]|nr:transposase [Oligoflexia bacterium]